MTLLDIVWNRTSFLLKENKYFTQINFWFPVAYVTVVGLFFRDKALECRVLNQEQVQRRGQRPCFKLSRKLCRFPRSILFEVPLAFGKMWLLINRSFLRLRNGSGGCSWWSQPTGWPVVATKPLPGLGATSFPSKITFNFLSRLSFSSWGTNSSTSPGKSPHRPRSSSEFVR